MKQIFLILIFISPFIVFSQTEKKETVYLLFDLNNKEKSVLIEDGAGKSKKVNKYRKEYEGNSIIFYIGEEKFKFHKIKGKKDTCSIGFLKYKKMVNLDYIVKKKSETVLRFNPFKKIYLIEKISDKKIIKYDVFWSDEWSIIE